MQSARLRRNFPKTAITSPAFYKFSRLDGMTLNVRMAQNPAIMTIFADPQSTHQFDPGDPVMKIPNPVGKRNPHMGFLHAMREGEEMYGYPVGSQGFTQIGQEGSQFLHMLNHLVGNSNIEDRKSAGVGKSGQGQVDPGGG